MLIKVQKRGNSLVLKIPKVFARDAKLEKDSLVEITMVERQIIITPVESPSWTLDKLLAAVTKKNIHHEVDTGPAIGNEVW